MTSKEMLQAERDMAKVEQAMEQWDAQMQARGSRQVQEAIARLRRKLREGRR